MSISRRNNFGREALTDRPPGHGHGLPTDLSSLSSAAESEALVTYARFTEEDRKANQGLVDVLGKLTEAKHVTRARLRWHGSLLSNPGLSPFLERPNCIDWKKASVLLP